MKIRLALESLVTRYLSYLRWSFDFVRSYGLFFLPSVTLLLGGIAVFVKPQLFIPVLSLFLITLGVVAAVCTWKALVIRERVQDIIQKFDGRITVHGVKLQSLEDLGIDVPPTNPKDQIIH